MAKTRPTPSSSGDGAATAIPAILIPPPPDPAGMPTPAEFVRELTSGRVPARTGDDALDDALVAAVALVAASPDSDSDVTAESFRRVVGLLDAADLSRLAELPRPQEGTVGADVALAESYTGGSFGPDAETESADEARAHTAEALSAIRGALVGAAPAYRTMEGFAPAFRPVGIRLRFRAAGPTEETGYAHLALPGETVRECAVSKALFALPTGAPVPCLAYDLVEASAPDKLFDRIAKDVHPALAVQGPAAVVSALWGRLREEAVEVCAVMSSLSEFATLAAVTLADGLPSDDLPAALVYGGRYGNQPPEPAGWRHVDRFGRDCARDGAPVRADAPAR